LVVFNNKNTPDYIYKITNQFLVNFINVKVVIQIKGKFKNKGNVMLEGFSDSVFSTLKQDGTNANFSDIKNGTSGQFLNILNSPENYALANTDPLGNNFSFGQLYISNFNQANIKGFASAEYRNVNHGAYQQIGLPFFQKKLTELNDELGKNFSPNRWTQNEILKWNNSKVVFDNLDYSQPRHRCNQNHGYSLSYTTMPLFQTLFFERFEG
jgi:hypothetical protein